MFEFCVDVTSCFYLGLLCCCLPMHSSVLSPHAELFVVFIINQRNTMFFSISIKAVKHYCFLCISISRFSYICRKLGAFLLGGFSSCISNHGSYYTYGAGQFQKFVYISFHDSTQIAKMWCSWNIRILHYTIAINSDWYFWRRGELLLKGHSTQN